ncbi:sorbosone dehydrogenase family protein [Paraglaciecola sp. L3A3]|uniref:PQQ-dependent sugar dehydrogenase n=1 Tax=Paraglaciecola sp. L3A3 TaxID=2686358 RepID=UPI00131EAFC1|nr:PQQ-dependent sugar dehydrogenase [Paraglaciecola sp. L3A3]
MKLIIFFTLCALNCLITVQAVKLKTIYQGFKQPVEIKFLPGSSTELLLGEKEGQLNFVDLQHKTKYQVHMFDVESAVEMGLLGVTFAPQFNQNQYIFVNYNPEQGEDRTRVSRFVMVKNKDKQYRLENEKVLIEIDQPRQNHNGGQVAFGPDGYLYIGMGDGGGAGDPDGHGQNTNTLLGNMLRLDINTKDDVPYVVPSDNPFVDKDGFKPEIWAYGIRNPWRFSFADDVLIVADVGQSKVEEVSVVKKGQNMGWNIMEGDLCFKPEKGCNQKGLTLPKITYPRTEGMSITGGFVYTGKLMTELYNHYIYADFILGGVWASKFPELSAPIKLFDAKGINLSTFALDADGEIYSADFASGDLYQLVP